MNDTTPIPNETPDGYKVSKTIAKAAPPLVLIVLIQALKAALSATNTQLSDDILYGAALAIYGGYIGLVNWIKNHKKKPGETAKIKAI
jgi:hypothetical protein